MKKNICIREYHLTCKRQLGVTGSLKFVFLTDLHNRMDGEEGKKIWELIEQAAPDGILVGGDVLVGKIGCETDLAIRFMKQLSERYPVWYANGNHEQRLTGHPEKYGDMGERYDRGIAETGAIRLINGRADLTIRGIPVTVYGFEPDEIFYKKGFRKKGMEKALFRELGVPVKDRYTILLSHHPGYGEDYLEWGADLTLSGHYHGGVVLLGKHRGLISPDYRLFSGFCCGIRQRGDSSMIVSAGVGEHTIPFRIHNPREITLIRVDV